jgi:hypothetical protein
MIDERDGHFIIYKIEKKIKKSQCDKDFSGILLIL